MMLDEDALKAATLQLYDTEHGTQWLLEGEPDDWLSKRAYQHRAALVIGAYLNAMRKKGWALRPREASAEMIDAVPLEGVSTSCWRAMWDAAEQDD